MLLDEFFVIVYLGTKPSTQRMDSFTIRDACVKAVRDTVITLYKRERNINLLPNQIHVHLRKGLRLNFENSSKKPNEGSWGVAKPIEPRLPMNGIITDEELEQAKARRKLREEGRYLERDRGTLPG